MLVSKTRRLGLETAPLPRQLCFLVSGYGYGYADIGHVNVGATGLNMPPDTDRFESFEYRTRRKIIFDTCKWHSGVFCAS